MEEYTTLRKFYAWAGFISLLTLAGLGIYELVRWVIWANAFVDASLLIK